MQICPNCGEENPPRFRLCGFCGTAFVTAGEVPAPREIRKTVTIVFSDLQGSTDLGQRLDSVDDWGRPRPLGRVTGTQPGQPSPVGALGDCG